MNDRPGFDDFDIISTYDIAYGFFEVAQELWRLAGRADRAEAIRNIVLAAYKHEPPRLDREHIVALREVLHGLEDALVGTVIDEQHLMSMAKVNELRGRTRILDLEESRGELARAAVSEALFCVNHLRRIADEALAADAQILFD